MSIDINTALEKLSADQFMEAWEDCPDDGSHINTFTLASFMGLWPRLNSGGLYIIEDLMCSYDKLQSEQNILSIWPGMKFNDPKKCYDNDRSAMDEFFRGLIAELDHQRGEALFVHFWSMMCVIGKVGK